jgi:hypothetical protein
MAKLDKALFTVCAQATNGAVVGRVSETAKLNKKLSLINTDILFI